MFRRIDDNRSGFLDLSEFKKGVEDTGLKLPDQQIQVNKYSDQAIYRDR